MELATRGNFSNSKVPHRDYLLAALRCGRTRLSLLRLELDEIGMLLQHDAITPQEAVDWVYNIGALSFVSPTSVETGAPG